MPHRTCQTIAKWAAVVLLLALMAYPLSYAPLVRWESQQLAAQGTTQRVLYVGLIDGSIVPAYKPIDWLIDNTPFDAPLFRWARFWGVEHNFKTTWALRTRSWYPGLNIQFSAPVSAQ